MLNVIGVRFKKNSRIYYFLKPSFKIQKEQNVIASTAKGLEYGKVEIIDKLIDENSLDYDLTHILRVATKEDDEKFLHNKAKEQEAIDIFKSKVKQYNLIMRLVDVDLTFDANKIIFYFTSETRVDFRELVRDLASIFKMRIELRQIGIRDQAKILNGIGICGRTLCCSTFLNEFQPVSIKMAKDQSLSLNPTKISGACGRLMCCLKYEQENYENLNKNSPKEGDLIKTPSGQGEVLSVDVLRQTVKAAIRKSEDDTPNIEFFNISEIDIIKRKATKEQFINQEELKKIED